MIHPAVREAVERVLAAKPGDYLTVRVPVGAGRTQAMILSCAKAQRPMIIMRQAPFAVKELQLMQRGQGRDCADFAVPAYVRFSTPVGLTKNADSFDYYAPDLIIVDSPPQKGDAQWKNVLTSYVVRHPSAIVARFEP